VLVLDVVAGSGAHKAGVRSTYKDREGRLVLGDLIQEALPPASAPRPTRPP
jgi:hypothetical protein